MSSMLIFQFGDYIQYFEERYNSGYYNGYLNSYHLGCVISTDPNCIKVVKQQGGQIWIVTRPVNKVSENEFLSDFKIYKEHRKSLMDIKNTLPEKLKGIVLEKVDNEKNKQIQDMFQFTLKNYLKHKNDKVQVSLEAWSVYWCISSILRLYEPFYIKRTIKLCYGLTNLVMNFMNDNLNFLISMQGLSSELSSIMSYLIEEQILEYKYSLGLISGRCFLSLSFPIRVIKLEKILQFRNFIPNSKIKVFIHTNNSNYILDIQSDDLFNTKFVIPTKVLKPVPTKTKCFKTKIVDFNDEAWTKVKSFKSNKKLCITHKFISSTNEVIDTKSSSIVKIKHPIKNASMKLNIDNNIVICKNIWSIGLSETTEVSLYSVKDGSFIGYFEFITAEFSHIFIEDVRIN